MRILLGFKWRHTKQVIDPEYLKQLVAGNDATTMGYDKSNTQLSGYGTYVDVLCLGI